MPFVRLFYRDPVTGSTVTSLACVLADFVAEALTCSHPDGKLSAGDVEIDVEPMPKGMRTKYDLRIEVEANEYPERRKNLGQRRKEILRKIRLWFYEKYKGEMPLPKGCLWVKLFPAEWSEF